MNVVVNGQITNTVTLPEKQIVTVENRKVQVAVVGRQGPQGVQGIQGPAGATEITLLAGEILGGHRLVVPDAAGAAIYADSTNLAHANKVLGMTVGAAILGANVTIQNSGEHTEPSWAWTLDVPIWLGSNGLMTQVQPTTGFNLIVAFPVTPTKIVIALREPFVLS